jgi:transposase-like protein
MGKPDREVAEVVGVSRQTLRVWRTTHAPFMAELNKRRTELFGAAQHRLRALVARAIANLEEAVAGGNLKASLEVLKAAAIYGVAAPAGPTDPQAIADALVEEALQREGIAKEMDPIDQMCRELVHPPNPRYQERRAELRRQFGVDDGEDA